MNTAPNSNASALSYARENVLGSKVEILRDCVVAAGTFGVARWVGIGYGNELRIGVAVPGRSGLVFVSASNCRR